MEKECSICHGEGVVDTMEAVYPGEPHMAPIGSQPCVCVAGDNEDEYEDEN